LCIFGLFLFYCVYGSQRRWAEALSGNQPFWQINFLLLLLLLLSADDEISWVSVWVPVFSPNDISD